MENKLIVNTPVGIIRATVMPDKDYPGICTEIFLNDGSGVPASILEYSPTEGAAQLRVYDVNDPDGEPAGVFRMSKKHPYTLEELESVLRGVVDYESEKSLEYGRQNLESMGFSEEMMMYFGFPPYDEEET